MWFSWVAQSADEKSHPGIVERIEIMPTTGLILAAVCVTLSIYSTSGQTSNSILT